MFRALSPPILRSTKQLHLQHLVNITPYCYLLLSWKSWNTQISFNFSTIAADNGTVWCLPDAVDAVALCSRGWVVTTPETCRAVIRLNKKTLWLVHLVEITYQIITMHGPINVEYKYNVHGSVHRAFSAEYTLFNNCNFNLVYRYSLSVNLTVSITM